MRTCKKCGAKPEAIGGNMWQQQGCVPQYTEPVTVKYCNERECKLSPINVEHLDVHCSKCGWKGVVGCDDVVVKP